MSVFPNVGHAFSTERLGINAVAWFAGRERIDLA